MFVNVLKYLLGILLAIAVLIVSGVAAGLYVMNRTSMLPQKPIFKNDNPPAMNRERPKAAIIAQPTPEAEAKATPSKSPKTTESAKPLPEGAYRARVTWRRGLSMRAEASPEAERVGSVAFNQKIVVLEENEDKTWQKIRLEGSNQDGWIKAGNTQQIDEQQEALPDNSAQPQEQQ